MTSIDPECGKKNYGKAFRSFLGFYFGATKTPSASPRNSFGDALEMKWFIPQVTSMSSKRRMSSERFVTPMSDLRAEGHGGVSEPEPPRLRRRKRRKVPVRDPSVWLRARERHESPAVRPGAQRNWRMNSVAGGCCSVLAAIILTCGFRGQQEENRGGMHLYELEISAADLSQPQHAKEDRFLIYFVVVSVS